LAPATIDIGDQSAMISNYCLNPPPVTPSSASSAIGNLLIRLAQYFRDYQSVLPDYPDSFLKMASTKVVKVIIDGGSCHNLASREMVDKLDFKVLRHPHPYHVQWLNDSVDIKIGYKVNVPFKIGEYVDIVECDVAPMSMCHLLLGRPWQYDRYSQHCGRTNQFTINLKGKKFVLKPMTPQQIMAEHLQKKSEIVPMSREEGEQKKLSAIQNSVSECHKPNLIEKKKGEGEHLVMLATKSEMREVRNNPE